MKKINALQLRQSLSKIISLIEKDGEPVLLERGRQPAAVIISLSDFKKRFIDKDADAQRVALRDRILTLARKSSNKQASEDILREFRNRG